MLDINTEYFYPMKTISSLICIFVVVSVANATIHTVSNNGFPAEYTNLTTAITAANPGDTLHIAGSNLSYGTITLAKSLTLMGEVAWPATGTSTWLDRLILNAGAEGTRIAGFQIWQNSVANAVEINCDDVVIERCYIGRTVSQGSSNGTVTVIGSHSDLTIRHCYITGGAGVNSSKIDLNNMNNVVIANNVIHNGGAPGTNEAAGNLLTNSSQSTVTISNNLFIHNYVTSPFYALTSTVHSGVVINNIFWGPQARIHNSVTGCVFNNNLQWQTNGAALPLPNNSGSGNLVVDPQFVNAPDRALTNTYDYDLQVGSPGHLTGSDGTDRGISGGGVPWPNNYGYPRVPRVTNISLVNGTIPEGGSLNTTVDGVKVD